jgi:hypothetical protein
LPPGPGRAAPPICSDLIYDRHNRPEALRQHEHLATYYKDIPVPAEETGVLGFIRSFFLTS